MVHNNGTIENCLYLGREMMGATYVGAIAGKNEGTLTKNYYHNNQYRDTGWGSTQATDNVGTDVKGVGAAIGFIGSDIDGAQLAKVVKLTEGGTFANPYGVTLDAEPTLVTTNNPNGLALSVYEDGILFSDSYFGDVMKNAFYTTAETIGLASTDVPSGYVATFEVVEGENSTIDGSTLTILDDIVEVKADARRGVDSNTWLAYRAASFSNVNESEKSIVITTPEELSLLAYNVNFEEITYSGYTITLGNDIDLLGHTWEPIGYGVGGAYMPVMGNEESGFLGTFDGAGKTIGNMNTEYPSNVGLFSIVGGGVTVKNVTIADATVKGANYVGGVAGMNSGTIENCHLSNGSVEFTSMDDDVDAGLNPGAVNPGMRTMGLGGIAGMCQGGSINGCTVIGTDINAATVENGTYIGGITGGAALSYGSLGATPTFKDCLFGGNIFIADESTSVGAIVGMNYGYTFSNVYYVDGNAKNATPNTTLKGIDGVDEEGMCRGYAHNSEPADIGNLTKDYGYDMEAYENGIHYSGLYYTGSAPAAITLADQDDNSRLLLANTGVTCNVTIDGRTLYKDGSWNTLSLPFNVNGNDNGNGVTFSGTLLEGAIVKTLDEASFVGGTLTLNFSTESTIEAGKPYLVKWARPEGYVAYDGTNDETYSDIVNPVFSDVTITSIEPSDILCDVVTFHGIYSPYSTGGEDKTMLYIGADNTLYYPRTDITINAFRAYFRLNDNVNVNANSIVLDFGDDNATTGILSTTILTNYMNSAGAWYDLSGRRISVSSVSSEASVLSKGIYINNGRKVVIK